MPGAFVHRLRVRYGECDRQGLVFNPHYYAYFDVALTELWRASIGPYTDMMASGVDMVVAESRARYLAPAGFDDELDVEVVVSRVGRTSLGTSLRVLRAGDPVVEGAMRHVFINTATRRPTEIPPPVRAGLTRYVASPADGVAPADGPAAPPAGRVA